MDTVCIGNLKGAVANLNVLYNTLHDMYCHGLALLKIIFFLIV